MAIVNAAAESNIKWFIPSEFGSNTLDPELVKQVPFFGDKIAVVDQLKTKESGGMAWTAFITGPFFDWCLHVGLYDIDIPKREAKLWNGGNTKWSTTTLATIGKAVLHLLTTPEALDKSKNRYVTIQSFKTSQNEVIQELEKITGDKFKIVGEVDAKKAGEEGREKLAQGDFSAFKPVLLSPLFGAGLGDHEKNPGLNNDLLLPGHQETVADALKEALKSS